MRAVPSATEPTAMHSIAKAATRITTGFMTELMSRASVAEKAGLGGSYRPNVVHSFALSVSSGEVYITPFEQFEVPLR